MRLNSICCHDSCAVFVSGAQLLKAKAIQNRGQSEISAWDIHSQNNALQNGLHANVY